MSDATYQPKIYTEQGGSARYYKSGASLTIESGASLNVNSGATLGLTGNISGSTSGQLLAAVMSGSTALTNFGHSIVAATTGAGASQVTIAVPTPGCMKTITFTGVNSSDTVTVFCSTDVTFSGAAGATNTKIKVILPTTIMLIGRTTGIYDLLNCSTLYAYTSS